LKSNKKEGDYKEEIAQFGGFGPIRRNSDDSL
jgi:hypothetical protein